MSDRAREFIDFWAENSIHAVEQDQTAGASQDVAELTRRLIEAAKGRAFQRPTCGPRLATSPPMSKSF